MSCIFYVESFYYEIVVEYKNNKKEYGLLTSVSHISVEKAISRS